MKPTTHKKITKLALEFCKDKLSSKILEHSSSIIQGTDDEDTTKPINRALNWHFYRAENSKIPKRVRLWFKPTSEDILDKRIDSMQGCDENSDEFYNFLGRIIHHIQDMSTPSHAMPIYHGPKVPLKLAWGMIDDNFEIFMEKNDSLISTKNIDIQISIDDIQGYKDIYHKAANDMLKNILKVDEDIASRPYSYFWKHYTEEEYSKIKGFGMYGECHNYFLEVPRNNQYNITKETLLNIQDVITTHAITNTCKALLYINTKIKQ